MNAAARASRRVLLVFPGRFVGDRCKPTIPLSILSLAAPLLDAGFEVTIFDQRIQSTEEFERLDARSFLFAGFSCLTGNPIHYGLRLARRLRAADPALPLAWGGIHPTLMADEALRTCELVDVVVRGEGEETVLELARALSSGTGVESVPGISRRDGTRIVHHPDRPHIDFEATPLVLPYHLLDAARTDLEETFLYQSSRGCPYDCEFCEIVSYHGRVVRRKAAPRVLEELAEIHACFHPKCVEFVDDLFFLELDRCRAIMEGLVKAGAPFAWRASCRVNIAAGLDEEFLALLAASRCTNVYLGAESASQAILDRISKRITPAQIETAVEKLVRHGIRVSMNFMSGFPGETPEDIRATMAMVDRLEARHPRDLLSTGGINVYAPYPGSRLFDEVVKLGFRPPATFEAWGDFILNDDRPMEWLPREHVRFLRRLALVSRWRLDGLSFATLARRLASGRLRDAVRGLFHHLFALRWRRKYFGLPLDILLWGWITRRVMRQG